MCLFTYSPEFTGVVIPLLFYFFFFSYNFRSIFVLPISLKAQPIFFFLNDCKKKK